MKQTLKKIEALDVPASNGSCETNGGPGAGIGLIPAAGRVVYLSEKPSEWMSGMNMDRRTR